MRRLGAVALLLGAAACGTKAMKTTACTSAAECPPLQACDAASQTCSAACSAAAPCNGGCCDGEACQSGLDAGACGALGGACGDCTKSALGAACREGACGCDTAADCPLGDACTAHRCGKACDEASPCNAGCCDGAAHECVPGATPNACSTGGALCASCAASPLGAQCVAGATVHCGCVSVADCPAGSACDPKLHTCGAPCDAADACRGGCCSKDPGGTCQKGDAAGQSGLCAPSCGHLTLPCCASSRCDAITECRSGACQLPCGRLGLLCCDGTTCGAGTRCESKLCVPDCGQTCVFGQCTPSVCQ